MKLPRVMRPSMVLDHTPQVPGTVYRLLSGTEVWRVELVWPEPEPVTTRYQSFDRYQRKPAAPASGRLLDDTGNEITTIELGNFIEWLRQNPIGADDKWFGWRWRHAAPIGSLWYQREGLFIKVGGDDPNSAWRDISRDAPELEEAVIREMTHEELIARQLVDDRAMEMHMRNFDRLTREIQRRDNAALTT